MLTNQKLLIKKINLFAGNFIKKVRVEIIPNEILEGFVWGEVIEGFHSTYFFLMIPDGETKTIRLSSVFSIKELGRKEWGGF